MKVTNDQVVQRITELATHHPQFAVIPLSTRDRATLIFLYDPVRGSQLSQRRDAQFQIINDRFCGLVNRFPQLSLMAGTSRSHLKVLCVLFNPKLKVQRLFVHSDLLTINRKMRKLGWVKGPIRKVGNCEHSTTYLPAEK